MDKPEVFDGPKAFAKLEGQFDHLPHFQAANGPVFGSKLRFESIDVFLQNTQRQSDDGTGGLVLDLAIGGSGLDLYVTGFPADVLDDGTEMHGRSSGGAFLGKPAQHARIPPFKPELASAAFALGGR